MEINPNLTEKGKYDYELVLKAMNNGDLPAIAGILINFGIGIYAVLNIRKKSIISYGILFYFITLSPVSNMFIYNGATMAERFMYTPSLGFCIAIAFLIIKFTNAKSVSNKYRNLSNFFSGNSTLFIILFVISGLYSARTISRNMDWKSNHTIYSHDVKVSDNSAVAHFAWGKELSMNLATNEKDSTLKKYYDSCAIIEFNKVLKILDTLSFQGLHNDIGTALADIGKYDEAINCYLKEIKLNPTFTTAYSNLAQCYNLKKDYENEIYTYQFLIGINKASDTSYLNNIGASYYNWGLQFNANEQYEKAITAFDSAIKYTPNSSNSYNSKGAALLHLGKNEEALNVCKVAIQLDSNNVKAFINVGCAYSNLQQYQLAIQYLNKAATMENADANPYYFLGITYQNMGDVLKAKQYFEKANRMNGGAQK